ncbi:MAG: hypothetical protein A2939_05550 [Parcubacteria group bacterium RIFCSPLOWO2_01_FULL_48_18]|nr:MAG: hypothetical protein A3J67_01045 [Parcubacteria group bacterium RIFCSPHIGHO2_02_FULL_48_10b]OHB22575.1 MAG: hypothetical protein A2939_05550 [Parcubacteria group bacterium RIFCSPLOWO2_01_FULL_48_18]
MASPRWCFVNGKIVSVQNANINVRNLGLQRGYGVFEFIRMYGGVPFRLAEHLARLKNSARALYLSLPISAQRIERIIGFLLEKNKIGEADIRILVLAKNFDKDAKSFSSDICILLEQPHTYPQSAHTKGIKLITKEHQREFARAKTINYLSAFHDHIRRLRRGALETLYVSNGKALECTTSNFFIFRRNVLITPRRDILLGITRKFVLSLARKYFVIQERNIRLQELRGASEAFIAATNKEIMPVIKIDSLRIGNGKAGVNTKFLITLFEDAVR